jgi:formylmethanofuran--tetrahydromethanopterin N-formyltransferase
MKINGVTIEDTFAEAFGMIGCRVWVTAVDYYWAETAGRLATGYACSVIACDAEAGIERRLDPSETPDGRPGVSLLVFAFSRDKLEAAVINRIGQCVMTCPTTACYDGLPESQQRIQLGGRLRYFGDGHQISKLLEERRFWRIPVMDGEFLCAETVGTTKGIAGGNLLILAASRAAALDAATAAGHAIGAVPDVICPFPGGIVRSGSKVGSKYKKLKASTNDAYCPTLRGVTKSALPDGVNAVYEIVIDGLSRQAVENALRVGIRAACQVGVVQISAGNYGGGLGPHHFKLHAIVGGESE